MKDDAVTVPAAVSRLRRLHLPCRQSQHQQSRQGIVTGYGNGRFGPNDSITREQLAVMLWRYNREPAATDKELYFVDTDQASSWALGGGKGYSGGERKWNA
ncbi:MAG: S-layer homology domain-containing protein [Acetatifactor sp.]|nr:S-layer homology domain-containing protein [Acetatifactor sp.]